MLRAILILHFVRLACLLLMLIGSTLHGQTKSEQDIPNSQPLTIPMTPPEDALAMIELPTGFSATLAAYEPEVHQPVAATFDYRGRLWVVECYTYSERPGNFDLNLKDRVLIFEDTNNDGVFDSRKVFWDQGKQLTGIELGFGGVWLTSAPHLIFIPDRDRDDRPDGDPEILLDGFANNKIRHNIVNGLRWGPDGWLYGRHGILETSLVGRPGSTASQRQSLNCGIWRFHPTSHTFEVVAHGSTNPWGFDFDQHGEMFMINTVIGHLFHVVPGARFQRMYGAHFNPHTYQVIPQTADHVHWDTQKEKWNDAKKSALSDATDQAGGGHAHCGMLIYQGHNWPQEFHNKILTANFHGRRINSEIIQRHGNGYIATHGPDYFKTQDPWFRGIELLSGPDGGVFVLDWSDIGECHERDGVHRTSGRIFKIIYGEQDKGDLKIQPAFDIGSQSIDELIINLMHPNQWFARKARRRLQELASSNDSAITKTVQDKLRAYYAIIDAKTAIKEPGSPGDHFNVTDNQTNAANKNLKAAINAGQIRDNASLNRLSLLWACYSCDAVTATELASISNTPDEHIRAWSVRMIADGRLAIDDKTFDQLARLAGLDESGLVRLYLASSLNRMTTERAFRLSNALADHAEDADDSVQPHLLWFGIEPFVLQSPKAAVELAITSKIPLLSENIARRITSELDSRPELVEQLLKRLSSDTGGATIFTRQRSLAGIAKALDGWNQAKEPDAWKPFVNSLDVKTGSPEQDLVQQLNLLFGDQVTIEDLYKIMNDKSTSIQARRQAIETVGKTKPDNRYFNAVKRLMRNEELTNAALKGMTRLAQNKIPNLVLNQFSKMDPEGHKLAIDLLSSRVSFAKRLLTAIEKKQLSKKLLSASHARRISSFQDKELTEQLKRAWGTIRTTPAEKLKQIDRLRKELTKESIAAADYQVGRKLFLSNCAICHVMKGQGGVVGPDLTGSDRKNINYLLENLVDPSSSVADSYCSSTVRLIDDRLLIGIVINRTKKTISLQLKDKVIKIDRDDIDAIKQTQLSLMPDGLLDSMTQQERAALFKYLQN